MKIVSLYVVWYTATVAYANPFRHRPGLVDRSELDERAKAPSTVVADFDDQVNGGPLPVPYQYLNYSQLYPNTEYQNVQSFGSPIVNPRSDPIYVLGVGVGYKPKISITGSTITSFDLLQFWFGAVNNVYHYAVVDTIKVTATKVGGEKLAPQAFTYPGRQGDQSAAPDMVKAVLPADWTELREVSFYYNKVPTKAPGNQTEFWFDSFKYVIH